MRKSLVALLSLGLLLGLAAGTRADEENGSGKKEKKLTLKDLPAAVQKTMKAKSKGWKIKAVWTEKENGALEYNAAITKGKNMKKEIAVSAEGKYLGSEEPVEMKDVPEAAQATIKKESAGHEIEELEKATDADGKVVYEFEMKDKKGEV